jgi:hypothetical protein
MNGSRTAQPELEAKFMATPIALRSSVRQITVTIAALALIPPGVSAPVTDARVIAVSESTTIYLYRKNKIPTALQTGQTIKNLDKIEVPAKSANRIPWARLLARQSSLEAEIIGFSHKTTWIMPCRAEGTGYIAWTNRDTQGCSPPGVVIRGKLDPQDRLQSQRSTIASATPPTGLQIGQFPSLLAACSAMNEEGTRANTALSLLG